MDNRPNIKITLTATDKMLELFGMISIIAIWILTISTYENLPDTIPIHYNAGGQVDQLSGKENILALPIIATILFFGLTILNRFPHIFNYPTDITIENAYRQYSNATKLFRLLKLIIVIIFGLIEWKTIQNAEGKAEGLGIWFLPITMGLIFIPLVFFVAKSFKVK